MSDLSMTVFRCLPGPTNTHYAVVIGDYMEMTLVACGPEEFCKTALAEWLVVHPLSTYGEAEILARDPAIVRDPVEAIAASAVFCQCGSCSAEVAHRSDCAVHSEPAYPSGPCSCEPRYA